MLNPSSEAAAALTARSRKIAPESEINLVDPDITYNGATASGMHSQSKPEQMYNRVLQGHGKYATCERGRAVLNGTYDLFANNTSETEGEIGIISNTQSNNGGYFTTPTWVQLNVGNLGTLQAASICFTGLAGDGYGVDFTFEVYSGATLAYAQTVTDNRNVIVQFGGFTAYDVTALRFTFTRWSLPCRFARSVEIIPGLYAVWDASMIHALDVKEEVDMSCMSCPYDTLTLDLKNENDMFNPRNKSGLFLSIDDRQDIPLRIGPRLADGSFEFLPAGTWYQKDGGWEPLDDAGLLMRFKLVSIIGLFADRTFKAPAVMPTTPRGWIAEILSQLGANFTMRYIFDDNLADRPLTCSVDDIANIKCGDLLRFVCMALGAYPRADKATGYLRISMPPKTGGITTTRSVLSKPAKPKANKEVSALIFKLNDASGTTMTISGTKSASNRTFSIANPFIKNMIDAQAAAKYILQFYGGQKIEMTGRGDLRVEMGDVESVELSADDMVGGHRVYHQYKINSKGIMKDVRSTLFYGVGATVYTQHMIITSSGLVQLPAGVTQGRLLLVQGGNGGDGGQYGDQGWNSPGAPGKGGLGGKVFVATINFNSGQIFDAVVGEGGAGGIGGTTSGSSGSPGGETTLGNYTSADGDFYGSYVDLETGKVYAADGESGRSPMVPAVGGAIGAANTGNGGGGGSGGARSTWTSGSPSYLVSPATPGGAGGKGGSGVIIISY